MAGRRTPSKPRVGHIQYLNCYPLYYGLIHTAALLEVELTKGTPTELNRWLLEGDLDVSPISSVEYLRNAADLLLLPDLTVSADGAVRSIFLVSKRPAEDLGGARVALANTSATSQALTRILFEEWWKARPTYVECPPDLSRMLEEADAALLIGDAAMRAGAQVARTKGLRVYDLGAEWKAHTGLPMVYAVWAVRRNFAVRFPELVRGVHRSFLESLAYSMSRLDEVAENAARWEPFTADELAEYFRGLTFSFGPRLQEGLRGFGERAAARGYLPAVVPLEFVEV
ncbi:MAG: menaquinone biosynthesis protein [Actinomycetota bacterium]